MLSQVKQVVDSPSVPVNQDQNTNNQSKKIKEHEDASMMQSELFVLATENEHMDSSALELQPEA